ncbi:MULTISPECIES: PAS domain-containing protein [unclassified Saccharicrinis]|uniref:PAS domain-containing protein n=1 Tax=unclassified Saccharicrinis TaxID=2646859 RepID=UPI003D33F2CE
MDKSLYANWHDQMLMLKKLTDASVVFLAEIIDNAVKVVASSKETASAYNVGAIIKLQTFQIDIAIQKKRCIDSIQTHSYFTSPIILSSNDVWGAIVVLLNNSPTKTNQLSLPVSTFNKTISDQVELSYLKSQSDFKLKCNFDISTVNYLLGVMGGVPWCLDYNSGQFKYIGSQAEQLLGYTLDDWNSLKDWKEAIHPDDRSRAIEYYSRIKDGGKDHILEYRFIKKDGSVIWIQDVVKVNVDQDDQVNELVGCMVNISQAKEREQGLEFLNNQLRNVLTATNAVLTISSEEGDIIFHSHEDIAKIDKRCYQQFRGADERCNQCPTRKDIKSKTTFQYWDKGKNFQVIACPYEVEPDVWHIAEVRVDISNRVSDDNGIAELKDRLEFGMKSGNIAYLEYDLQEKVLRTNSIFENVTGLNLNNEVVDLVWMKSRIHEKDYDYILEVFDLALNSDDKKLTVEFRFLRVDNKYIWVRFTGQLLMDEQGASEISGILIDISDTKELMNALMLERNKSLQASEAKSMFLANMSHEIRTPMNAIIGFSELLSKHIVKAPLNGYLNSIKASGKVLLALINDLLDLEKIEAGKMVIRKENTDFVSLLREIEQTFSMNFAEKQIDLLIKPQVKFPKLIYVDSLKIKQILLNLVNNALKFTSKGEVEVQSFFKFNEDEKKGTLSIKVCDTGIGIAQNKQNSIFEPFIQDKNPNEKEHQGTGLGLSIVQKLVRMMGGLISLESEVGLGSTFSIVIPDIEATDDPFSEIEGELEGNIKFNQEKVLIVDNVETNLEVLSAMCSNLNLKSIVCAHGKRALELALTEKPEVIIMDLRVPKHNKFKSLKDIKGSEDIKHIPVIAVSSSSNIHEAELAGKAGFDGFISKPIPEHKLIQEICKFVLPNEEEGADESVENNEAAANLSMEDIEFIKATVNDTVLPLWQSLKEILSSEKLSAMLYELNGLKKNITWPALERYTVKLDTAIKSYDFETIQKLIYQFEPLLEDLN